MRSVGDGGQREGAGPSILLSNYNVKSTHPIQKVLYTHPPKGFVIHQHLASRQACWARTFRNCVLGLPEYDLVPKTDDDAVLSVGLTCKTKKPWSAIMEHYSVFSNNLFYPPLRRPSLKRHALKMVRADNCHRILAYTDIAGEGILKWLGDKSLKEKIETLYPVIADAPVKRVKHDVPTVLFIANTDFYGKGGKEVLAIADNILKRYDAEFIIKSPVPEEYLRKYQGRKGLTFITSRIPDAELNALYDRSDVFLFPLYTSSFGVYLEAKRAALPVVTSAHFDMTEIVRDNIDGFTIDNPQYFFKPGFEHTWFNRNTYTDFLKTLHQPKMEREFTARVATLIEDGALARRMGNAGKREIVSGRFNVQKRNKQLARIYQEMAFLRR